MKTLPSAPAIEAAVIACALLDSRVLDDLFGDITGEDFHDRRHRYAWEACEALHLDRKPVDLNTVGHWLEQRSRLDVVGGYGYLAQLDAELPSLDRVPEYVGVLRDQTLRRKMIDSAQQMLAMARAGDLPAIDSIGEIRADLDRLELRVESTGFEPYSTVVEGHREIAEREYRQVAGLPTGISEVDDMTLGFEPGHLWIVAGRPGQGKTAFALSIARHLTSFEHVVGIASLEMAKRELLMRDVAAHSGIDFRKIRTGRLSTDERERIRASMDALAGRPLHVDDSSTLKSPQLASRCRRLATEWGLDCLIVDYLQLMEPGKRRENRNLDVADVTISLRALAKDLGIPVIALAQLSRGARGRANKRPELEDLRDSGQIEQDAYGVMFLHRDNFEEPYVDLIVAKNRGGQTGTVSLHFDGPHMTFRAIDRWRE